MAIAHIVAINYDPPGRDVEGEYVVIRNSASAPLDLLGWTLHDVAPVRPHVYTFKQFVLQPNQSVRVWTRAGADTPTDLYMHRGGAVWNNPGDTAILRDNRGTEVSRFRYLPRSLGTDTLRIAVPAFWDLELSNAPAPKYEQHWQNLIKNGAPVSVVVIDGSWPGTAEGNPAWKAYAQKRLDELPGKVLGYVSTRVNKTGPVRTWDAVKSGTRDDKGKLIFAGVDNWYEQFGQQIDGIYFDELALHSSPETAQDAQNIITQFRNIHSKASGAKLMILAGQYLDDWVVGDQIDWALLWEQHLDPPYTQQFYPALFDPGDADHPPDQDKPQYTPSWWKDPANRSKIVHVVHDCHEPDRQHTLGLALERNAGHVFVMDRRGLRDQTNPKTDDLYDHLPPYWEVETREVDSYYDFGFDPLRVIQAAHNYGMKNRKKVHAWPNFEAAWYDTGHVRGTFLLDAGEVREVLLSDLPNSDLPYPGGVLQKPSPFDIPRLWNAVHKYAREKLYETGLPTFILTQTANGPTVKVILLPPQPWLQRIDVLVSDTYQQPTFAEPGAVIRNINRVASAGGAKAAFPTFEPDDSTNPTGRSRVYRCYVLKDTPQSPAPVEWEDVPTSVYLQYL